MSGASLVPLPGSALARYVEAIRDTDRDTDVEDASHLATVVVAAAYEEEVGLHPESTPTEVARAVAERLGSGLSVEAVMGIALRHVRRAVADPEFYGRFSPLVMQVLAEAMRADDQRK